MADYRNNHYVPEWYQYRFFPDCANEKKFYYLDLAPDVAINNGKRYQRKALLRWGPPRCFRERDLYTTRLGAWESTEIEQKFFGQIDSSCRTAFDYFANFEHPGANPEAFNKFLLYMSLQKMRTPKGLVELSRLINLSDKNHVLIEMQRLRQLYCALWTECIWSIADATESDTKFIISDHPVTVYNQACFPHSRWCRGHQDPDIWLSGTHTLFPLDLNKLLILTNLSWVRNPYGSPLKNRPNPQPFRHAMFNFLQIQTGRNLSEEEVNEINYVIKQRAYRYIAAQQEEWLYPEKHVRSIHWNKLGSGYLFMPDPRSVSFSTETIIGYKDGRADAFDEYGRKPWEEGYTGEQLVQKEWNTFHAFQGEFARVFGPKRRGRAFEFGKIDDVEDSADFHAYHLRLEQKFKPKNARKIRR